MLGQLQPFIAVFPQDDRNAWANWRLFGRPNTFVLARKAYAAERRELISPHAAFGDVTFGCPMVRL
jgi:hypothetical protein